MEIWQLKGLSIPAATPYPQGKFSGVEVKGKTLIFQNTKNVSFPFLSSKSHGNISNEQTSVGNIQCEGYEGVITTQNSSSSH
jgi:hypothetical protein